MIRLRDSILYCQKCGAENFYEDISDARSGKRTGYCWSCKAELNSPFKLRVKRGIIMLNHDTKLYPHHLDPQNIYDFSIPIAAVVRHPQNPSIWGLKNLSGDKWSSVDSGGSIRDIEPGQSITLSSSRRINFGKLEGEIQC
jgi:hypothetical protein